MATDISSSRHTGDLKQDELRSRDLVAGDSDSSHSKRDDRRVKPVHEEGKMFIGGLNWETTDESLRTYFSQFGEVTDCVGMRDPNTGRSRGFGFLTFVDSSVVNTVLVKEHHLDGKIIDPKRAIPREEQEKTEKIFVGGIAPEVTEDEFKEYFTQFGNVIDATLMVDRDTGRPRGFGFITFDSSEPVERAMARRDLEIRGKPIEVKRAMPKHKSQRAQSMYSQSYAPPSTAVSAAAATQATTSRYQGYAATPGKDSSMGYTGVYPSNSYPNYASYGQYSNYSYPSSYPTSYSGYNAMTQAYYSRYANSYNQYSGYSSSGSRGGNSYSQWYRGDGSYGSGGPSSGGSASPLPGPSSVGRLSGGYHRGSPSRDESGYAGRDHHHHHHTSSPAYGRGSSRTGAPMRYSNSVQTSSSGGGPLYSSQQVRNSHNYHPYAR